MHGKRWALALSLWFVIGVGAANAESAGNASYEGSPADISSMRVNDIFSLKTAFGLPERESAATSKTETDPSPEDLILERWKRKQLDRWVSLPRGTFEINASAYTAAADECGKSDGVTASGLRVAENRTLACPPQYPFGAKINIEGYGTYRCEDRGGAIKGNRFDIYMETKREAFAFGRRHLVAEVVFD